MNRDPNAQTDNLLQMIIDNSYDSIFVTDKSGIILLANPACCRHLNLSKEQLLGSNVKDLIKKGYYDRSTALEAAEQKRAITGIVNSLNGMRLTATSTPLFGENKEVTIVITNSRNQDAVEKELEKERARVKKYEHEVKYLRDKNNDQRVVAESELMKQVLLEAKNIAKTDSTVMIYGESGTGKEVISNYIHRHSRRSEGPFITLNCATIPEALLESELFGYEKGAFTGASAKGKPGLFEVADGGTIFLDEIAELPILLQPKLLRVLESSEVRRVGGTRIKNVDVRVIGATNKNLKQMVADHKFRDDLYYRLNVIPITIPPLKERPEDIITLADTFLAELNQKYGYHKSFTLGTISSFLTYPWPGNVRELRNVVERLVITTTDDEINSTTTNPLVSDTINSGAPTKLNNNSLPYTGTLKEVLRIVEDQYIKQTLAECDNCVGEAAQRLGIHRSGLYRKICEKTDKP